MCTVSWRLDADGYEVLFNRDELRTRTEGLPPRRQRVADVGFLAPIDPDGKGTWIAVNQAGVTLCLVNGYQDSRLQPEVDLRSRGRVITDLAGVGDLAQLDTALRQQVVEYTYRSFRLLAFAPATAPRGWRWSGNDSGGLEEFQPVAPVTSSSLDAEGAARLRSELFATLPTRPGSEALLELHRQHAGGPITLTPCMHRREARTVSLTRVLVGVESVAMEYAPGPPCRTALAEPLTVERIAGATVSE